MPSYSALKKKVKKSQWPTVTVFSSVSDCCPPPQYKKLCRDLGALLAKMKLKMAYSGADTGCAKWLADGAEKNDGAIKAVTWEGWHAPGKKARPSDPRILHPPKNLYAEYKVAHGDSLGQRIEYLKEDAIAIVTLPGGPATMQELWNTVVGDVKPYKHTVPHIIVNIDNFFDGTKKQVDAMVKYFDWPPYRSHFYFVKDFQELKKLLLYIKSQHLHRKGHLLGKPMQQKNKHKHKHKRKHVGTKRRKHHKKRITHKKR